MADKSPDVLRDAPNSRWDDDPYRGVDVTIMQRLLTLTPAQRLRYAVEAANALMQMRAAAHKR